MTKHTSWPRGLLMVLEFAVSKGADRRALEKRVGIGIDALRIRDKRIPLDLYYQGIEVSAEMLDSPHCGLDFIDAVEPRVLDALGFFAASAATVGEAFSRIFRFHRFMVDGETFALSVEGDAATFTVAHPGPSRIAHAHVTEMYLADCLLLVPRMTGHRPVVRSVHLAHDVPDRDALARRIGFATPTLGADRNAWTMDASILAAPMPRPDPALSAFLEGILVERAEPYLEAPLPERVRAFVEQRLADGAPALATTATELGLAPRTLQRHLADAGTSYDALVDSVRRVVVARCRARGLSLEETALLCGYADPSSFHRARRRWRS